MYNSLQPSYPLIIPFMDGEIQLKYGFCLWLCATSGKLKYLKGLCGMTSILFLKFGNEVVYPTDHDIIYFRIFRFLQIF